MATTHENFHAWFVNILTDAALWSAIAAIFAAVAAFLVWRTQVQQFRHSARPELVLVGWDRSENSEGAQDEISFSAIENVGQGAALHVYMNSFSLADDGRPMTAMTTKRESLVASGAQVRMRGEVSILWNNVAGSPGAKSVPITIEIYCWDTTGIRYHTEYNLLVVQRSLGMVMADSIAPGVMLARRVVTHAPVWRLKLNSSFSKLPIVGKFLRVK